VIVDPQTAVDPVHLTDLVDLSPLLSTIGYFLHPVK
jgi:hypothetical protein